MNSGLVTAESTVNYFAIVGGVVIFALAAIFVLWLVRRYFVSRNILPEEWQPITLLLTMPKVKGRDEKKEGIDYTHEAISLAESLFSAVGGLRAQRGLKKWIFGRTDFFSFEIVARNGLIFFYAVVPKINQRFLEQQLNSVYPSISIEEVADYNIFQPRSVIKAAILRYKREYIFPIRTYRRNENDPLSVITNGMSKIAENEGAVLQLVMRSAYSKWHYKGKKVASLMQQGKTLEESLRQVGFGSKVGKIFEFLWNFAKAAAPQTPEEKAKEQQKMYQLSPMEQEMVKGIEEKTSKAGVEANLRLIVSTADETVAKNKLNDILYSFSQFNVYQYGNALEPVIPKGASGTSRIVRDSIYRNIDKQYSLILNTEEVVSLWHMPLPTNETPNIMWLKARKAAPPVDLPMDGTIIGLSQYRGVDKEVRIKRGDRRRHVYTIGQTGTGKSTLLKYMMLQDIRNGEGCCVIDPHGDFALDMLANIPKSRAEDIIYFDPMDTERPMGINMLEHDSPEQKTFVINELLSIFDKLYDLKTTGGPMFEQYMRNALLLVMEDPESGMTLMEIPKVMADADFRRYKLSKCKNLTVKDFWVKEAEKAGGEAALANMVPYITSKLTPFIANDIMRPIISQQKSSLDFRKIMDEGKILVVNLTKGKLGEINSSLLGMIIVGKILLASLSRVDVREEERKDFYLYIDEFQNFTTDSITVILSEARKYRLNLIIAHQYIGQLVRNGNTSIRDAVFGNVGTTISFRIGVDDAEHLAKQFKPIFDEFDLVNVPKYTAYIRLLIDNGNPPAFNISTLPVPDGSEELLLALKELSRLKYGRPREEVESEIIRRTQITNTPIIPDGVVVDS
ncbi:MAG: type IV secretion system DNA-binding domain-containing protein [Candidatus Komeilibacteria bacterium]|nr:type IV secretion system DNA-binding domain-containing protein [Candidatus Komeilibacteria bacterium]